MSASWLIDKSALVRLGASPELVRLGASPDVESWANRVQRGRLGITTVTLLEAGYSARSAAEMARALTSSPLASMPVEYLTPAVEDRAVEVQRLLAERGHRAPSIRDLLIAAAAELNQRAVLHLDKDFDLIAALTGQPMERLRVD